MAVLPEAEEVELELKPDEMRIEVCRAGGPGGQGVNTTDSAPCRCMHIPTGTIVRCQDGRSQIKNKEKALSILRARLLERKQAEEEAAYSAHRKSQIGSGGREEKIRTYNFPQNRVTDHRINVTLYNLDRFMEGDLGGHDRIAPDAGHGGTARGGDPGGVMLQAAARLPFQPKVGAGVRAVPFVVWKA